MKVSLWGQREREEEDERQLVVRGYDYEENG